MADSKYGAAHRRARGHWARVLTTQGSLECPLCRELVFPWHEWHLDHVPGTTDQYRGVAHAHCNESEGATRGHLERSKPKPRPLIL